MPARWPGPDEHAPEVPVRRTVVEFALVLDRPPGHVLRRAQDFGRILDFVEVGLHRIDDRADLRRVDAPHAKKTELRARSMRIDVDDLLVRTMQSPALSACLNSMQLAAHMQRGNGTGGRKPPRLGWPSVPIPLGECRGRK